MTCRDMVKETLGQSGNRDIPHSKRSIRVFTFMHLGVKGVEAEMQYTSLARQVAISREIIACRQDQPANINHMEY